MKWKDEFFKSTMLVFVGISLFNLFNLLYHFFMVRNLNPPDYGQLNTLLALFILITVPANTVQTTITRFVSVFQANFQQEQTRAFLNHFLRIMVGTAFLFLLAITLASQVLSAFLQIPAIGSIFLLGAILFFAMITPVPWGGLQGLQRFGLLTMNLILNGGLKLGLGVLLVIGGWGVLGAMGAIAIAYFVTTFLSLLQVAWLLKKKNCKRSELSLEAIQNQPSTFSDAYRYFLPVGIMLLCFMTLTQVDLLVVKHLFTPVEAGYYSIAQMVGKMILFLPLPVVMVMFPKVTLLEAQKRETLTILIQSLIITGVLCGAGILFSHLFPHRVTQILTGKVYPECNPLIKLFSINMTLFSLIFILLHYHLAKSQHLFLFPLALLTILEIVAIALFNKTMIEVLTVVGVIAFCLLVITGYLTFREISRVPEGGSHGG